MSKKKLEPCPFCGSSASLTKVESDIGIIDWHLVECDGANDIDCGARSQGFGLKAHAIAAWNRRSSPTGWREGIEAAAKEIAERITALQQQIAEHNKWGHWLEAAAVERTILELKQRHFAIDSLTPPGDKEKE